MVTAIFSVLPSSSQNVCDKIRLSSGKVVDFNYALTKNDTAYICLDQPEANADWRIETYIDGKNVYKKQNKGGNEDEKELAGWRQNGCGTDF